MSEMPPEDRGMPRMASTTSCSSPLKRDGVLTSTSESKIMTPMRGSTAVEKIPLVTSSNKDLVRDCIEAVRMDVSTRKRTSTSPHLGAPEQMLSVVVGEVDPDVLGDVLADVDGEVLPVVEADVLGDVVGLVVAEVVGDVVGDVLGDVVGDVLGDVLGEVEGEVVGDVLGEVVALVVGVLVGVVHLVPMQSTSSAVTMLSRRDSRPEKLSLKNTLSMRF